MFVKIKNVDFIAGAKSLSSLPESDLPEIAFVGRSNVGKSTLINRLTGRKKLARTSSTPGRTTEINFFKATLQIGNSIETLTEKEIMFVDLPGYGFAKFAKTERESLSKLTVDYITKRLQLNTICLLNDCRRTPESDELAIRNLAFNTSRHLLILLTKIDKLNQKEKNQQTKQIASQYNLKVSDLILSGEKTDTTPLLERLVSLINL